MRRPASSLAFLGLILTFGCGATQVAPEVDSPLEPSSAAVDAADPVTTAAASASPAPPSSEDRSQAPLHRTREVIGGAAFTIEVPEAPHRRASATHVEWYFREDDRFLDPVITIVREDALRAPKTLDVLEARNPLNDAAETVTMKRSLPDGTLLLTNAREDGQYYAVHAVHRKGDTVLHCSVMQRTGTGRPGEVAIVAAAATRVWAEKLCQSLVIE
jgi:hypothetical protein